MAQSFQTDFATLVIPQAATDISIVSQPTGLAANGILFLVGEADQGPAWSQETDTLLNVAAFGPGQSTAVAAKYGSGPLVDGYRQAAQPSNDNRIKGAPQQIFLVKTNISTAASLNLPKIGGGTYSPLSALKYGAAGNVLASTVTAKTPEIVPTTGAFTWINNVGALAINVRVNGGAATVLSVGANTNPASFAGLAWPGSVAVSGGGNRGTLAGGNVGNTITVTLPGGNSVVLTISATWAVNPQVGDTMYIPSGSALDNAGGGHTLVGAYVVTAASNNQIVATKLSDANKPGATTGSVTAPSTAGSPFTVGSANDVEVFAPISVAVAPGNVIDGIGKSLEISDGFSGGDLLARYVYAGNSSLASWTTGTNQVLATNRQVLGGVPAGTLATGSASGYDMTITFSQNWAVQPRAGDTVLIPLGSVIAGIGNANAGLYAVSATTATTMSVHKVVDFLSGAIAGDITAVLGISAVAVASTTDLQVFAAQNLVSASEYSVDLNNQRSLDSLNEDLVAGGPIALQIGYQGTSASLTISTTALTTTVVGGGGAALNISLAQFATIKDLCTFISTQTGYSAQPGNAVIGQLSPSVLDRVSSQGIATSSNSQAGRVKMDAQSFFNTISQQSIAVVLGATPVSGARAAAGLPAVMSQTFMSGAARGGSSTAQFLAAIDALASYIGNFVVPLVSQNATIPNGFGSSDVALGLTDPSSTYVAQTIMAYANTHVLAMSKAKKRKNRQAFCSVRDTFSNAKTAASNIAGFRTSMCFQDVKGTNSLAVATQFQPWMGAVTAAAMQAAGFYRLIVRKFANISGIVQAAGDFNDQDDDAMEAALKAGLLPLRRHTNGGFYWVSDQTTYGRDNTPIPNSIQAVYVSDIIAVDLAESMEDNFDGESVADITASGALTFLEAKFAQYMRLKLTAASSDAPKGFKGASITLAPPAMSVQVEAKVGTGIYFIPIKLYVSTVTQSANQ